MFVLLLGLLPLGCHDKGAPDGAPRDSDTGAASSRSGTGSLQGVARALDGATLAGITVTADGQSATTDEEGRFYLDTVSAAADLVVSAAGEGWSTGSERVTVNADTWAYVAFALLPASTLSWDPTEGPELVTDDDVSITFPAEGLVDEDGAPAEGPFDVTVAYLDVRTALSAAPGGLLASTEAGPRPLRSGGMVEVRLAGSGGARLQLAAPAQLSFPVPDDVVAEGLSSYVFDEGPGLWVAAEGGAVADGRFSDEVEHFSWWNADEEVVLDQCVVGQLLLPDGTPLAGGLVDAVDTENYMSGQFRSDSDGRYQIELIRGATVTLSLAWGAYEWEGATVTVPDSAAASVPEDCLDLGSATVTDNDVDDDGYLRIEADGNDCDDEDDSVHPRARERWYDGTDQDCDGNDGDQDEDGYLAIDYDGPYTDGYAIGDCDDTNATRHPDAPEACDGTDDNCSGDESDAVDATVSYLDEDGDGYGQSDVSTRACEVPEGYATEDGDCQDTGEGASEVHPNAEPACTEGDQNCDGVADQSDQDGDGVLGCEGDCDDEDATINPSAADVCDEVDNDCDGDTDGDPATHSTVYPDLDSDGYGDESAAYTGCFPPEGMIAMGGDCDDADATRWSGADEVCDDGVVNNCDSDEATATAFCDWDDTVSLATVGVAMTGERYYDRGGNALATVGDADGDGRPDQLVGASRAPSSDYNGAAYLILDTPDADGTLGDAAWARLVGEDDGDYAGSSVAAAGDQDGDGLDDLLIGAIYNNTGASNGGAAHLVLSLPVGDVDLGTADMTFAGDTDHQAVGYSVAGGGDADGDGAPDLMAGASGSGGRDPAAWLLLGPVSGALGPSNADLTLAAGAGGEAVGARVLFPGDTDGDGLADLLNGATTATVGGVSSGAAYLIVAPGAGSFAVSDADAIVSSTSPDSVGYLFPAGDIDGDGLADVGVSARSMDAGSGVAGVWLSPLTGDHLMADADLTITGGAVDGLIGLSGGEDVDGDEIVDILVGASNDDTGGGGSGAAALFYGPLSGALSLDDADQMLIGGTMWGGDAAGGAGTLTGDLDGDGRSELLIGATGYDTPHTDGGAAFLVHVAGY